MICCYCNHFIQCLKKLDGVPSNNWCLCKCKGFKDGELDPKAVLVFNSKLAEDVVDVDDPFYYNRIDFIDGFNDSEYLGGDNGEGEEGDTTPTDGKSEMSGASISESVRIKVLDPVLDPSFLIKEVDNVWDIEISTNEIKVEDIDECTEFLDVEDYKKMLNQLDLDDKNSKGDGSDEKV